MNKVVKEHSVKYLSSLLQLGGIACSTALCNKVFNMAISGNIKKFSSNLESLIICAALFTVGVALFYFGWSIMYSLDENQAKNNKKV